MPKKHSLLTLLKVNIALAILYFSLGLFSIQFAVSYKTVASAVFIPEGIALAFLIIWGRSVTIGVFIGQFILAVYNGLEWASALMISSGNSLELIAASYIFQHFGGFSTTPKTRDYLIFIATVFLVCQPISAGIGVMSLLLFSNLDLINSPGVALYWYLGNATAQILLVPAILIWRLVYLDRLPTYRLREFGLFLFGFFAIFPILFNVYDIGFSVEGLHAFSIVYPLLIWVASRYELQGVCLINICIVLFIQIASSVSHGPFFMDNLNDSLMLLNSFNIITVITSTLLAFLFYEKRQLQRDIIYMAHRDSLTNLLNRRRFLELASVYFKQQKRSLDFGAIILIDIDDFKMVNDRYGHDQGDAVLVRLSKILNQSLREVDLIARYGGEEFIIYLSPPIHINTVIKRLQTKVSTELFFQSGQDRHFVTLSIGVHKIAQSDHDLNTTIKKADKALYYVKEHHKDGVEHFDNLPLSIKKSI